MNRGFSLKKTMKSLIRLAFFLLAFNLCKKIEHDMSKKAKMSDKKLSGYLGDGTLIDSNGFPLKTLEERINTIKNPKRKAIIEEARKHVGKKWEFGKDLEKSNATDCSHFVWYVYKMVGKTIGKEDQMSKYIKSSDFADGSIDESGFIKVTPKPLSDKEPVLNTFQPKPGDVIGYNGHVVMVVDPEKCVFIEASNWVMDLGSLKMDYKSIVSFAISDPNKFIKDSIKLCSSQDGWIAYDQKHHYSFHFTHQVLKENDDGADFLEKRY
jgi:hypothetical protein